MIRVIFDQEAFAQFGYKPDEVVKLDTSMMRKVEDVPAVTVGDYAFRRNDNFPVMLIKGKQ